MIMNWQDLYDAFPVNREMIWLNNCGTTPAGRHVLSAVSEFLEGYARSGILTEKASYAGIRRQIKSVLAPLLNCRPDELALIHNTAEGMNFISHGLGLSAGDELILLENEYPSNIYPWRHLAERGVRLVFAPMAATPEAFLESLVPLVTANTRAMALSAVHWCTGMPLPLSAIGALCRERGVDLIVDGAQGVGIQPIDVREMGISFMAFSAWKWLMGPLGVGVMYVAREKLDALPPVFVGTESVVDDLVYLPYKEVLKPSTERFTYSTGNWNDWVYFAASLSFLNRIGFDTIRGRIFELSTQLAADLSDRGWTVLSDRHPNWPTGIVVAERPGTDATAMLAHLKRHRIVAAERLGRLRFSPHIYISPPQLKEVVEVLAGASKNGLPKTSTES
jgi:selenocysteine lyase/cysteine desulfurase